LPFADLLKGASVNALAYWIGFNRVRGIGPARLRALLDYFGTVEQAWLAPADALREIGLDRRSLANLLQARSELDLAAELDRVQKAGIEVLTWEDPRYPERLQMISDPPPVLYVRGEFLPQDDWAVAMVGTRHASTYGREAARQLAGDLARAGVTIISGLARGIDAQVHRAVLDAGGRTLAVLGSGVDIIYPHDNFDLAREIIARGALISEYPLGTQPEASNFPPRNRIISGLSRGVIVVEAGEQSGALITADFAAEQGRDVFAVPGSIFQRGSRGTNRLIRDGAQPVLSANDVLEALNMTAVAQHMEARTLLPADETETLLLKQLSEEPAHVDDVGRAAGLPIATVSSTLALMELKGLVRQVGGMNYVRARESGPVYQVD
jgi:DNA processing protein